MEWTHADVSLEQFVQHVGAFLDILILTSGCQSEGSPAVWTPRSLRKALDWACYLEQVLNTLPPETAGDDSKRALDLALEGLFQNVPLPPGMTKISSGELVKARSLMVRMLVQALPAENAWLIANVVEENGDPDLWEVVTREISERCMAFGCVKSLQLASELAARSTSTRRENEDRKVDIWQNPPVSSGRSGFESCNVEEWVNKGLVYISSAETIHKLSGAALIFAAGRSHWVEVFDSLLSHPDRGLTDTRVEIAELCCLFMASPRWKALPRNLLHSCCKFSNKSVSLEELEGCWWHNGLARKFITVQTQEAEQYLQSLRALEKDLWSKLHPLLLAVALTDSSLLEDYVKYIDENMLEISSSGCPVKCPCGNCQRRSDARERAWCLLMRHRFSDLDIPCNA